MRNMTFADSDICYRMATLGMVRYEKFINISKSTISSQRFVERMTVNAIDCWRHR